MARDVELDALVLRRVIDGLHRAIVVTDAKGTIRLWSDGAERIYGWSEASVLGRSIFEILEPGAAEVDGAEILATLLEGHFHRNEQTVVHRDGSTVRVHGITRALVDANGEIEFVVGATDDLAEVAALELAAESLSAHLRLALDAGGLGTWRWDLASGVTIWDAEMERLFGVEAGAFDGTYDAWQALLHPDDLDDVLREVDQAVANRSSYRLEHRIITPSGEVRWIEGAGRVTLDGDGLVTGTIGCCHEITERAWAEQQRERLAEVSAASLARERVQRERLELVAAVNDALEDSDDLATLMARVTEAVVPRLGDWCSLYVLASDADRVPLVATAHREPEMVSYAEELRDRFPFDPDAPGGIAAVIREGRSEFHPVVDEELIAAAGATEEQRQIVRDLGLRSVIAVPLLKRGRSLGAMELVMADGNRSYTEEDLTLVRAVAARIGSTLDNRRLRVQRARTARTDAALAGLGRRLAASASVDEVLAVIAEDAPPVLGALRVEVGLALDAESITITGEHARVIPIADAGPLAVALAEAETIVTTRLACGTASDPREGEVDGSLVASPLYDDLHRSMGVLVLSWNEATDLDEVDLNAIETLSRLCGQSIVRAQLATHTEQMASLAASMAAARTTLDVARLLREHGTADLRASLTNLRLIDPESATLVPVLPSPIPIEIAERYERVPLDQPLPLTDSVRDQEPVWIADLDDYRLRYPESVEAATGAGLGATAVLPVCDSDGEVMGAVTFGWPTAMHFDHRLRSRLTTLSGLAAQTLERVRLFEAEHAVVRSMQRRLLTPLPVVDGLAMAAFYEPAASAVGMGGDWYEAVALPDGSVVVIIGDVVGHGVDAVAAMAQIQHLLTGLLRSGTPLGDVLARANAMMTGPELTFATAVLLHIDPVGGRVGYSSAGHPWALLRHPDGSVQRLDANQQPMFGMFVPPNELVYETMPAGSLLLAYTDGLVERRSETIDEGIDRLAGVLGAFGADDLDTGLHDLVDEVRSADPEQRATTDDVAAVLIRVLDVGSPSAEYI